MLCGVCLRRFGLGRLPRQRVLMGLSGITPVVVVTLAVTRPGLLLVLTAAINIACATLVSPEILRVSGAEQAVPDSSG
jgi:hypothetical protein